MNDLISEKQMSTGHNKKMKQKLEPVPTTYVSIGILFVLLLWGLKNPTKTSCKLDNYEKCLKMKL